jgi:hypothetical protein
VGVLFLPNKQHGNSKKSSAYTYAEFYTRLSHWALTYCEIKVTHRVIRDWSDENLLPGPTKIGLGRGKGFKTNWDALAYRRACRICGFKKKGTKYFDELHILLWLAGEHVNIKDLRRSCLRALKRFKSSKDMNTRSNIDLTNRLPSARTIKAFRKRGASVDKRIVPANFTYSGQEAMEMLAVLKTGEGPTNFAQSLVKAVGLPSETKFDVTPLVNLFSGLFANPDESQISSQNCLEAAEATHFKLAREELGKMNKSVGFFRNNLQAISRLLSSKLDLTPISNSFEGMMQHNFRTLMFIALVGAIQRGEWPPKIIPSAELEKIVQLFLLNSGD